MHILQELRLCRWRVTAQENIDLSSESASSTVLEFLRYAAKELAKNTLLDILVLPDAWSKRVNEQIVDIRFLTELFELGNLLFSKGDMVFI